MVAKIDICNKALQKLGRVRVSSLTEDSENAREINFAYDTIRRQALCAADWRFAEKRVALAADTTAPVWGYAVRYALPADCLRIRKVKNVGYPWEQVGDYIETDLTAPLYMAYTEDIEDTTVFTPGFVDFFATLLAIEVVEKLTQSGSSQDRLRDRLNKEISDMSLPADADQGTPEDPDEDDWVTVRL